jgi:hypothetical protein
MTLRIPYRLREARRRAANPVILGSRFRPHVIHLVAKYFTSKLLPVVTVAEDGVLRARSGKEHVSNNVRRTDLRTCSSAFGDPIFDRRASVFGVLI